MPTSESGPDVDLTVVRRLPDRQVRDRSVLDAVLDAGLVGHVGVADGARPFVVPLSIARDRDDLLVHGSAASRALRLLAGGAPACVTVTIVDGLVVARSQFQSSMRYRCAMIFGNFEMLHGQAKKRALAVIAHRLLPGLEDRRPPSVQELAATTVLALPLNDSPANWSVKVSAGQVDDRPEDRTLPVWAGVVPLQHTWGEPEPAPDLPAGVAVPQAIAAWPRGRA